MDFRTTRLLTMSMDELYRRTRRGEIRLPIFHRGGQWSAEDACSFLNRSFSTMIFEALIFSVDVDHSINCIDGWRRLQAISGDPGLWYDFASGRFYDQKQGPQSLDLISVAEKGPQGCISELSLNNAGALNAKVIESVPAFFRKWESRNIPVFSVSSEHGNSFSIFEEINSAAFALPPCKCIERPTQASLQPFDIPTTGNSRVISSSIYTTNHRRFFGLDDADCAVHFVDVNTVNNLARNDDRTRVNIETLIRHARNCVEQKAADRDESRARSLIDRVENDISKTRELWERFENTDCVSDPIIEELESALKRLRVSANECHFQDEQKLLPTIPVRFDGCFLPEKKTVCGEEFLPGIYISDNPSTDPTELLYHELTHAYLHAHKKVYINCPWIEEGLAELCGKLWQGAASGRPTLDPSEYTDFEPKNSLYYNFLEAVIGMRPASIKELFQDYTGTNPSPKPDLDWCNTLIRPYCL